MTIRTTLRLLGATAMIAGLSACGGGGGGGGDPEASYTAIQPMKGMTAEDYQALQDRGVIAADGEGRAFSSLASTRSSDAGFSEAVGFRNDGQVIINAGRTNGETTEAPSINVAIGQNDDNERSFHPDYGNETNNVGNQMISGGQGDINGQTVYLGRRDERGDETRVIYIPRGDSEMYVGAYASDVHGTQGTHGVFGRETTAGEMGRLTGTASYRGVAAASVNRNENGSSAEGGYYEGTSTANVNFDTNRVNMDVSLGRDRELSPGTDTIDMTVQNAQIANDGRITGAATYNGLSVNGQTVTGSVDGHFFGPNGESIGATYIGTAGNDNQFGHIVGHTVLNQD